MIWKPHVTVATVIPRSDHYLMVEEDIDGAYFLNQPAGHLEDNETLVDAAIRETLEESAWHVEINGLVGVYRWKAPSSGATYIRVCFHGRAVGHEKDQQLDVGIVRALWMTASEINDFSQHMRSPLVMQCLSDYLKGHNYPLDLLHEL